MTHKNPQEERETAKQLHVQEPCGDGGTEAKWHLHFATKQWLRSWDVTSTYYLSVSAPAHTLVEIHLQREVLMVSFQKLPAVGQSYGINYLSKL